MLQRAFVLARSSLFATFVGIGGLLILAVVVGILHVGWFAQPALACCVICFIFGAGLAVVAWANALNHMHNTDNQPWLLDSKRLMYIALGVSIVLSVLIPLVLGIAIFVVPLTVLAYCQDCARTLGSQTP
jgi:hypothetical protein